jgi:hypothetical protein
MIKSFRFRAQAIFNFAGEDTPPWFTKYEFEKFFSLFYIISTQRSNIHQQLDTNSCFDSKFISVQFFFIHPVYRKI